MSKRWVTLLVTSSAISLVFLNGTILPVALPTIEKELSFSEGGVVWVVNAYLLALVALVLLGGKLGDIFGLKRVYGTGMVVFTLSSLFCALSTTPFALIFFRALCGAGGALMFPASGALLIRRFPKHLRGKAVGTNVSIGSVFLVMGPLLGGLLTQYLSWRYVFWFNLPIALFGFTAALLILPKEAIKPAKIDVKGALLLALGVGFLVVGIMQGESWGWKNGWVYVFIALSPPCFLLYGYVWKKTKVPILNLFLFKNALFFRGTLCLFLAQFILMIVILWAIYFQEALNYSPAGAGALLLFSNIPVMLFAPFGGHLSDKWGPKVPVSCGFLLIFFSLVWIAFVAKGGCYYKLAPGLIAFGAGVPMVLSPSFATAMHHVNPNALGQGVGASVAIRQLAATLGVAVISALFLTANRLGMHYDAAFILTNLCVAILALFGVVFALIKMHNNDAPS